MKRIALNLSLSRVREGRVMREVGGTGNRGRERGGMEMKRERKG